MCIRDRDGPTDAAGAKWSTSENFDKEEAISHLIDNDSYNFWVKTGWSNLIKKGHTGTNVADIVICHIFKAKI